MILETTDIIAIIIALAGACFVMIWSIQDNRNLRKYIAKLEQEDDLDKYIRNRRERLNAKKNNPS
jgi:hypothetical protein